MMPVKPFTTGLIALVALIVLMAALAVSQVDLTGHKERIEQLVLEQTGRQMKINGPVNAKVFPWVGLSLNDVTLSNAAGFEDPVFATAEQGRFQVQLRSLLIGKLKIKSVGLQGLSLRMRREADGKTNWDDLLSATAVVETETDGGDIQEVEAGAPVVAALSIGGLEITDADITYTDARDERYLVLNNFHLTTGAIVLSEAFAFESGFNLNSSRSANVISEIDVSGDIAINLNDNIHRLKNLKLASVSVGAPIVPEALTASVEGELVVDLNQQTMDFEILTGSVLGVPLTGEVHAADWKNNLWLVGELGSGDFEASRMFEQLGVTRDENFDPALLQNASFQTRFEHADDALKIPELVLNIGDMQAMGDIRIANLSTAAVVSGQLQSNTFNPAPWLRSFDLPISTEQVMQSARFDTSVRQSGQLLAFSELNVEFDETQVVGDVEIVDINSPNPPINFALTVDRLDVDRYLRTSDGEGKSVLDMVRNTDSNALSDPAANTNTNPGAIQTEVLPENESQPSAEVPTDPSLLAIENLRQIEIDGEVMIEQLTLAGVKASNAYLSVLAKTGKIEITEAKAELYSGSFSATASLDVQADEPLFTARGNLHSLQAEPLLQDMTGSDAALSGIANVSIDLLSRGNNQQQLLERTNGAFSVRLTDGVVRGIEFASELQRVADQESIRIIDSSVGTNFTELGLSAVITDGVLQSDDLQFISSSVELTGEGGVNLAKHTLDYLLHIKVVEDPQLSLDDQPLAGVETSVPLRGQFSDYSSDIQSILIHRFETNLRELNQNPEAGVGAEQKAEVAGRIESEKAALRDRIEKEREDTATLIRENAQSEEEQEPVPESEQEVELEREKDALKDKLKSNFSKGIDDQLGEN